MSQANTSNFFVCILLGLEYLCKVGEVSVERINELVLPMQRLQNRVSLRRRQVLMCQTIKVIRQCLKHRSAISIWCLFEPWESGSGDK